MCNYDSQSCVQNKYLINLVRKMVLCCSGIQNQNIRGAEAIRRDKVKQGRNVPEGGNNSLRRQRCAKITFLGQNSIQVSQRRVNAKCELWRWWYACTSCNPAFVDQYAHAYNISLKSLSRTPGAAWGLYPMPGSCPLPETPFRF
ncbi:Hypothetical_protein [Hexamita inflata]|uniref:Hypothetical_protein n=1 Tax=Hexamita inflata TaxID=28002 RepID=A0AA86P2D7_9EUKA|nr:Hypothetical protein HINF_LOCUS17953 [Hexamita inflata]CAI9972137.1 Hypothetical protein HINF_LOCUS59782 [Hexamita inflata]